MLGKYPDSLPAIGGRGWSLLPHIPAAVSGLAYLCGLPDRPAKSAHSSGDPFGDVGESVSL